jgi:hypothetical protein
MASQGRVNDMDFSCSGHLKYLHEHRVLLLTRYILLSDYWDEGIKGYQLTRLIRNDSLLIRNVTIVDTLIDRMHPTEYPSFSTTDNHEDSGRGTRKYLD